MNLASKFVLGFTLAAIVTAASAAGILTGKGGMTLYTFDKDSAGASACNGQCAILWPIARPGDASGKEFGEIARADGGSQLTFHNLPLYYYAGDHNPRDTAGDGAGNVWHVAQSDGGKKNSAANNANGYGS